MSHSILADLLNGAGYVTPDDIRLTEDTLLSTSASDHLDEAAEVFAENFGDFDPTFDPTLEGLFTFNQDRLAGISDDTLAGFNPDDTRNIINSDHAPSAASIVFGV